MTDRDTAIALILESVAQADRDLTRTASAIIDPLKDRLRRGVTRLRQGDAKTAERLWNAKTDDPWRLGTTSLASATSVSLAQVRVTARTWPVPRLPADEQAVAIVSATVSTGRGRVVCVARPIVCLSHAALEGWARWSDVTAAVLKRDLDCLIGNPLAARERIKAASGGTWVVEPRRLVSRNGAGTFYLRVVTGWVSASAIRMEEPSDFIVPIPILM
jgi:hypothetical protein